MVSTSVSGTRKLSPEDLDSALRGIGILVPMVEARFLSTKLKRNGPELSDAMLVPPEKVESLSPTLDRDDLWDITEDARDDQPPSEVSGINIDLSIYYYN